MIAGNRPSQPVAGPHRPLASTPARRPGSARRTWSIDVARPELGGSAVITVRGQDLVTAADGSPAVVERIAFDLTVDERSGRVITIDAGDDRARRVLEGAKLRAGFGRHLAGELPDGAAQRALLYSVLEDLPAGFLVSGYSGLRNGTLAPVDAGIAASHQADICIGWAVGGPVHVELVEHAHTAVPRGPDAGDLEAADPDGWHPLPTLAPGTVRRRRQLDVWADDDGALGAQSHFRDSYAAGDEPEMVMHEYLVEARVVAGDRLADVAVDARVLPWQACPGAVASAAAVDGVALGELGPLARSDLVGPTTCTHLTSSLRDLADVQSLRHLLAPNW
jgi:hypothetical protein